MVYDPSIYRVYTSLSQFTGSDMVEFHPGEFAGRATRRNPGSSYIRDEGLEPFLRMLAQVAPGFDRHGETRLAVRQSKQLLTALEEMSRKICRARSAAELESIDDKIPVDDGTFVRTRAQLVRTIEDIAAVTWQAWSRRRSLWVLGGPANR